MNWNLDSDIIRMNLGSLEVAFSGVCKVGNLGIPFWESPLYRQLYFGMYIGLCLWRRPTTMDAQGPERSRSLAGGNLLIMAIWGSRHLG